MLKFSKKKKKQLLVVKVSLILALRNSFILFLLGNAYIISVDIKGAILLES